MNNVESLESMGMESNFVFIDIFTGTTVDSRGITNDISNEKRQISRMYSQRIESNEDLMNSLLHSGQFSAYVAELHHLCEMWDKMGPDYKLTRHINHGVQAGLSEAVKALSYQFDRLVQEGKPANQSFQTLFEWVTALEVDTRKIIDQVPVRNKKTQWKNIKSIDIREVLGLEIKAK